jgi:hypothetical protein
LCLDAFDLNDYIPRFRICLVEQDNHAFADGQIYAHPAGYLSGFLLLGAYPDRHPIYSDALAGGPQWDGQRAAHNSRSAIVRADYRHQIAGLGVTSFFSISIYYYIYNIDIIF